MEKLFNDSVRKLKARDKELAAVTAERDSLAAQQGVVNHEEQGEVAVQDKLKAELEVYIQLSIGVEDFALRCHACRLPS